MTLAHELQHSIQHAADRDIWAYNTLVMQLPKTRIRELGLTWQDVPTEREARIVAKRACELILGVEPTADYIEQRISSAALERDRNDWVYSGV